MHKFDEDIPLADQRDRMQHSGFRKIDEQQYLRATTLLYPTRLAQCLIANEYWHQKKLPTIKQELFWDGKLPLSFQEVHTMRLGEIDDEVG